MPRSVTPLRLPVLQRVIQPYDHGCGIAAVATLAGLSYGRVSIDIFGDAEGDETSLDDLRRALIGYGFAVPRRMVPFWEGLYSQLKTHALLALDPDRFGTWHAAVWDGNRRRILNPLRVANKKPVVVGYLAVRLGEGAPSRVL